MNKVLLLLVVFKFFIFEVHSAKKRCSTKGDGNRSCKRRGKKNNDNGKDSDNRKKPKELEDDKKNLKNNKKGQDSKKSGELGEKGGKSNIIQELKDVEISTEKSNNKGDSSIKEEDNRNIISNDIMNEDKNDKNDTSNSNSLKNNTNNKNIHGLKNNRFNNSRNIPNSNIHYSNNKNNLSGSKKNDIYGDSEFIKIQKQIAEARKKTAEMKTKIEEDGAAVIREMKEKHDEEVEKIKINVDKKNLEHQKELEKIEEERRRLIEEESKKNEEQKKRLEGQKKQAEEMLKRQQFELYKVRERNTDGHNKLKEHLKNEIENNIKNSNNKKQEGLNKLNNEEKLMQHNLEEEMIKAREKNEKDDKIIEENNKKKINDIEKINKELDDLKNENKKLNEQFEEDGERIEREWKEETEREKKKKEEEKRTQKEEHERQMKELDDKKIRQIRKDEEEARKKDKELEKQKAEIGEGNRKKLEEEYGVHVEDMRQKDSKIEEIRERTERLKNHRKQDEERRKKEIEEKEKRDKEEEERKKNELKEQERIKNEEKLKKAEDERIQREEKERKRKLEEEKQKKAREVKGKRDREDAERIKNEEKLKREKEEKERKEREEKGRKQKEENDKKIKEQKDRDDTNNKINGLSDKNDILKVFPDELDDIQKQLIKEKLHRDYNGKECEDLMNIKGLGEDKKALVKSVIAEKVEKLKIDYQDKILWDVEYALTSVGAKDKYSKDEYTMLYDLAESKFTPEEKERYYDNKLKYNNDWEQLLKDANAKGLKYKAVYIKEKIVERQEQKEKQKKIDAVMIKLKGVTENNYFMNFPNHLTEFEKEVIKEDLRKKSGARCNVIMKTYTSEKSSLVKEIIDEKVNILKNKGYTSLDDMEKDLIDNYNNYSDSEHSYLYNLAENTFKKDPKKVEEYREKCVLYSASLKSMLKDVEKSHLNYKANIIKEEIFKLECQKKGLLDLLEIRENNDYPATSEYLNQLISAKSKEFVKKCSEEDLDKLKSIYKSAVECKEIIFNVLKGIVREKYKYESVETIAEKYKECLKNKENEYEKSEYQELINEKIKKNCSYCTYKDGFGKNYSYFLFKYEKLEELCTKESDEFLNGIWSIIKKSLDTTKEKFKNDKLSEIKGYKLSSNDGSFYNKELVGYINDNNSLKKKDSDVKLALEKLENKYLEEEKKLISERYAGNIPEAINVGLEILKNYGYNGIAKNDKNLKPIEDYFNELYKNAKEQEAKNLDELKRKVLEMKSDEIITFINDYLEKNRIEDYVGNTIVNGLIDVLKSKINDEMYSMNNKDIIKTKANIVDKFRRYNKNLIKDVVNFYKSTLKLNTKDLSQIDNKDFNLFDNNGKEEYILRINEIKKYINTYFDNRIGGYTQPYYQTDGYKLLNFSVNAVKGNNCLFIPECKGEYYFNRLEINKGFYDLLKNSDVKVILGYENTDIYNNLCQSDDNNIDGLNVKFIGLYEDTSGRYYIIECNKNIVGQANVNTWGNFNIPDDGKFPKINDCYKDIKDFTLLYSNDALTSTANMFASCESLESVDISKLNFVNIIYSNNMFFNCKKLTNVKFPVSHTKSLLADMDSMFLGCESLKEVDLSSINCFPEKINSMFYGCEALENVDLSGMKSSSKLTQTTGMFLNCKNIKKINISGFDAENTNVYEAMFGMNEFGLLEKILVKDSESKLYSDKCIKKEDFDKTEFGYYRKKPKV